MAADRTTLDEALKDFFLPLLAENLNNNNLMENQVVSGYDQVSGRKAVFAIHTQRNSGVGARPELGALPTAGNQSYKQANVGLATLVGRISISSKAIRTMTGGDGAYVLEPQAELEGLENDLNRDKARIWFGTGDGVLANTDATTSSTTVNIADGDLAKTNHLAVGTVVDIGTVADPTAVASDRTINTVNENDSGEVTSIVISGAEVTTATTDRVFRAGSGGEMTEGGLTYGVEPNGLGNIVNDTGALHDIDPADDPIWESHVNDNAGTLRDLSDAILMSVAHRVFRNSGAQPSLVITTDGALRDYGDSLVSLKRSNDTVDLKGGFSGLKVAIGGGGKDMTVTWDRDVASGLAFAINTDPNALKFHTTQQGWQWADEDGAVLSRVAGQMEYEAHVLQDVQLATAHRNRHARIEDLND